MPINTHRRLGHSFLFSHAALRILSHRSVKTCHHNKRLLPSSSAYTISCYKNQYSINYFSTAKSSMKDQEESVTISSSSSSPLEPTSTARTHAIIPNKNTNNISSTDNSDKSYNSSSSNNHKASSSSKSLLQHYETLIASGEVTRDPHQIRALRELDRLRLDCLKYVASPSFHSDGDDTVNRGENDGGWSFASLFSSWGNKTSTSSSTTASSSSSSLGSANQQLSTEAKPKGVYLHGGVGCGKTYCMDLFYNSLPDNPSSSYVNDDDPKTTAPANNSSSSSSSLSTLNKNKINIKQKVHFHKFMLNIHKSIHTAKTTHSLTGNALINHVIQTTLSHGKIICFDEFQVTDIADALLLKRLFTALLERGAVVVATSNRPPCDLYKGGLQRDLFIPFIDLLEEECCVVSMWESEMDYRLVQKDEEGDSYDDSGKQRVYFVGNDGDDGKAKRRFDKLFHVLTKGSEIRPMVLDVQGREVKVPMASEECDIARFSFRDLCAKAAGAADYLAIGERFHTVFIEDVPKLQYHEVNLVRRWITLIDALYENHVKLVILAETKPEEMFQVDLENEHCDEVFAFDRTRSRMEEMRSENYLRKKWTGHLQLRDDVDRAKQIDYMQ
eukprot:scaffold9978_cov117-Skeletonema_menzelii.AAC.2